MALLELKNVGKSFSTAKGPRSVLRGVNLSVEQGEFLCIVGYSGSGKSTLVSLIAGLLQPDEGEITLAGRKVDGPGPDRGIIFQNYSLLPWMSVLENIYLAVDAVNPKLNPKEKRERAEHYVKLVGLEKALWKKPAQLSGGMRQRVAVARGLATDPKILLLDEPFSALDALTRANLQLELGKIWSKDKKTVLMITNDVDEAILLADRIVPLTSAPGSTLGPAIPVPIPRPRLHRNMSLNPDYQSVRKQIIDFLTSQSQSRPGPGAARPIALEVVA